MLDAITEPAGPSDEGLAVNIIQFANLLRENGISVTLASVLDAIRGFEFIDISNLKLFHGLLRLNFVHRKEDFDLFDQLFFLFWLSKQQTGLQHPPSLSILSVCCRLTLRLAKRWIL